MKKVTIVSFAVLLLAASLGGSAWADPAEKGVTWQLINPMGGFEVTQLHAPRLDTLEGKTICELSIDAWQSHRILPAVREALKAKYPSLKFVPFTEFAEGYGIDADKVAQLVKEKGCQAAVLASAG